MACFPCPTLVWRPRSGGNPSEFLDETYRAKTRGMGLLGLLYSENCMILTSTVFDWSTRVPERQTDGQTDGIAIACAHCARLAYNAVARKNCDELGVCFWCHVTRCFLFQPVVYSREGNISWRSNAIWVKIIDILCLQSDNHYEDNLEVVALSYCPYRRQHYYTELSVPLLAFQWSRWRWSFCTFCGRVALLLLCHVPCRLCVIKLS